MSDPVALYCDLVGVGFNPDDMDDPHKSIIIALYAHAKEEGRKEGLREAAWICDRMTDKSVRGSTRGATGQVVGLYEADATSCRDAILAAMGAK